MMSFLEENMAQVHPITPLIFHRDHQHMSKLIDYDSSCSESDSSIDASVWSDDDYDEELHNNIDGYARPETIVPSFNHKVDGRKKDI